MTSGIILLATDLSCRCDRALDRATMLAREWHARLIVLHVLQQPQPILELSSGTDPPDSLQIARARVREDMGDADGIEIDVMVERGDPASRIFDVSERFDCRLILSGVARDETLGRILLGTTVEKLVRMANVPVLVVKSRPRDHYRKVVVATDFSEGSRSALQAAIELFPSSRLTLFHAFDVPFEGLIDDRSAASDSASKNATAEAQAFLASTPAAKELRHGIEIVTEHGEAGALLQDMVHSRGVDLVVLGTEGRSGASQLLLGSVAQNILNRLSVDVLVVRRRRN